MDNDFVEKGIISDFTFDLAYGKDENDFEITTPENEMLQGYYWYIKDTEYGGVVDEIEARSNSAEVIYKGRSWQGILNSFSGVQISEVTTDDLVWSSNGLEQGEFVNFNGSARSLLEHIVNDLQLPITITDDTYEEVLNYTVNANQYLYDMLTEICTSLRLKMKMYYEGGICLGIEQANDYTQKQYFDNSQYVITANSNVRIPNHLIGIYRKEGQAPIIKHIYTDEQGNVQPYYVLDANHEKPMYNAEYYRCEDNKVVSGINEIVEVVEGGSTVENYDVVTQMVGDDDEHIFGTSGNTPFVRNAPYDWADEYFQSYYRQTQDENNNVKYEIYEEQEWEYEEFNPRSVTLNEWKRIWGNYFKRNGVDDEGNPKYERLTDDDVADTGVPYVVNRDPNGDITPQPSWWKNDWKEAKWREFRDGQYIWHDAEGNKAYGWSKQILGSQTPDRWSQEKGDYYFDWTYTIEWKVKVTFKGKTVDSKTVKNNLNNYVIVQGAEKKPILTLWGLIKSKKKATNQNFSKTITVTYGDTKFKVKPSKHKTERISIDDYCSRTKAKKSSFEWNDRQYWLRTETEVAPNWANSPSLDGKWYLQGHSYDAPTTEAPVMYYKQVDTIIPEFLKGVVYRKVTDDYTNLCEAMLKVLNDYKEKAQKVEPKIDTDLQEFDVGDIIGGVHPFTKEQLTSRVTKKIVNGSTFKVEVEYEIG